MRRSGELCLAGAEKRCCPFTAPAEQIGKLRLIKSADDCGGAYGCGDGGRRW